MPKRLTKILLFLSAYAPLGLIIALQWFGRNTAIWIPALILSLAGIVVLVGFIHHAKKIEPTEKTIASTVRRDGDSMAYIVTYLLPFLPIGDESTRIVVSYTVLFVMLAIVYVHSDLLHTNPTLNLLGYRIYEVDLGDGEVAILISSAHRIRPGQVKVVSVGNAVYLEVA